MSVEDTKIKGKMLISWKNNKGRYIRTTLLGMGLLLVISCWQSLNHAGEAPALIQLWDYFQSQIFSQIWDTHMPVLTYATISDGSDVQEEKTFFQKYVIEKVSQIIPVTEYAAIAQEYDTVIESELTYEMILALEGADEDNESKAATPAQEQVAQSQKPAKKEPAPVVKETPPQTKEASQVNPAGEIKQEISLRKLDDFDYLLQNFYQVDRTTTISGGQLNAAKMLEQDLTLKSDNSKPQILVYHTHSQEAYRDSDTTAEKSVVGVGKYLAKLLREQYGFNVLHDTGKYDLPVREDAYSKAGPALERILADNPSIEVVIDLHRDGVGEDVKLVSEVNGKTTAQVMFFNGLSRTTSNGDIAYLKNPYIQDNLAFSFQMKLIAEQYYPGFARPNYLKGYRYNLHYAPKSLLVEVGAQTNHINEAMNAMEPLADMLHKVLKPK
jgi:stage II sporulation protein P